MPQNTRIDGLSANSSSPGASEEKMPSPTGSARTPPREGLGPAPTRRVAKGIDTWLTGLIRREGPGILRMLWRLLGLEQDVMDAYQDCFCKLACRHRDGGKFKNPKAYAYRTATNVAIEMIRSRARRRTHWPAVVADQNRVQVDRGNPESGTDREDLSGLREAVASLPAHLRGVVVLRDLGRLSYNEVGKTLGIDPATARVYRRHAVVKLAELLAEGNG